MMGGAGGIVGDDQLLTRRIISEGVSEAQCCRYIEELR
jgi:hypothetical protein